MARTNETTKGFDVYRNGMYLGFVSGQSKAVRKRIARMLVSHTHMGEWIRTESQRDSGVINYTYSTTTGVYIRFEPCKRLNETLVQYLLPESEGGAS